MAENNAEPELLYCYEGQHELPESEFWSYNRSCCRECMKRRYREWYRDNKARRLATSKAREERIKRGEPSNSRRRPRSSETS